jgi:heavy metal sensor kinase
VRRLPIRWRLTAWYVLALALVLTALGAFVVTRLRADLTAEVDRSLASASAQLVQGYRAEGAPEFVDVARSVLPGLADGESGAKVVDASGRVVVAVGRSAGDRMRTTIVPLRDGSGAVVVAAESLGDVDDAVDRVLLLLVAGGLASLAVLAAGGWWLARGALRPVEQMTTRADAIDIGDLSQRIAVPEADDELAHLARTLNAMLERLEGGVAARERLIADASHELRAPLAAMRSEIEVSLRHDALEPGARAVLESTREEVVRMGRIVDDLLTLARADGGRLDLLVERLDLRAVADSAGRRAVGAAGAPVEIRVEGEPAMVRGDRDRLEQVVGNLLDNAVRVAPRGTRVDVRAWRHDGEAGITVSDEGPGVPPEARERIFERFSREDPARGRSGGAGLGLAICREIVLAHGGRIWVAGGTPRGSAFSFALPEAGARGARPWTGAPGPPVPPQAAAMPPPAGS